MTTQIQPTAAELEMIRLKREEEENKAQQDALQNQLEYDKLIKEQIESFELNKKDTINRFNRNEALYEVLCTLGVKDYITKKEYDCPVQGREFIVRELHEKDVITEVMKQVRIDTKWGMIGQADSNGRAEIPSLLSNRCQSYTPQSIAKKIMETIQQEKREEIKKETSENYFNNLVKELKLSSPEGTKFFKTNEYISNSNYGRRGQNPGYYQDYLKIEYPNGSWVKLAVYLSSWNIKEKFDNKYIKPETNEEWLKYLSK